MTLGQKRDRTQSVQTDRNKPDMKVKAQTCRPSVMGDISGTFADLGTFVPLVTGVLLLGNFDPARVLVCFGLFAIATGVIYRRPIPVQPMKAVAALTISGSLHADVVTASGLIIGLVLIVLALGGLIKWLQSLVPRSVLQGVQLGLGVSLLVSAARLPDTRLWISAALLGFLLAAQATVLRSFSAIGLLVCGVGVAIGMGGQAPPAAAFSLPSLAVKVPAWSDFAQASYMAVLPQLALTLTNAVLLTAVISAEYFPQSQDRITARNLALSSGALNAVLAPFGAMPMCHGAGGLAAQYGQGARTGLAPVVFGSACLLLAVVAGPAAITWLMLVPGEVVAALLAFAGLQLMTPRKLVGETSAALTIIIVTALMSLVTNVATGLVVGLVFERLQSAMQAA